MRYLPRKPFVMAALAALTVIPTVRGPDPSPSLSLRACRIRSLAQSFHFLPEASTAYFRLGTARMAFSAPTTGPMNGFGAK
jgi:hypothetical protein